MIEDAPFYSDVASAPDSARAFWLKTSDRLRLRIIVWTSGTRGTAFVFPGRTEYAEKYGRVAGQLLERNLSVVIIDWRGQGLSTRPAHAPMLGYVRSFQDYQLDVEAVLAAAIELDLPEPNYMVAHSMGGCIGLRTLCEKSVFSGAIMSAPMWGLQFGNAIQELRTKLLGPRSTATASTSDLAAPGAGQPFKNNALTSDPAMFQWAQEQVAAHPDLGLGPPSIQWSRAAIAEIWRRWRAPRLKTPALVFLGSAERIVSRKMIRLHAKRDRLITLEECNGARHEIFMENTEVQKHIWSRIDHFLTMHPKGPAAFTQESG